MIGYQNNMQLDEVLSRAYTLIKSKISLAKTEKEILESSSYALNIITFLKNNLSSSDDAKKLSFLYDSMILDLIEISNKSEVHKKSFLDKINSLMN